MNSLAGTKQLRSDCPTNYFLEVVGDKWSLLIIRDIAFWGKVQNGEFRKSDEHIATNILVDRLKALSENGIIKKTLDMNDRRSGNYTLTDKGLGLMPILLDIVAWSDVFGPDCLFTSDTLLEALRTDREKTIQEVLNLVSGGSSIFSEPKWQPHRKNSNQPKEK